MPDARRYDKMDEHGRRARLRPREELSLIRRFFAFVLAVGLTAAALFMMFPSWLNAVAPEINLSRYGIDISRLDIYHFPFYGSAGRRAEGERHHPQQPVCLIEYNNLRNSKSKGLLFFSYSNSKKSSINKKRYLTKCFLRKQRRHQNLFLQIPNYDFTER